MNGMIAITSYNYIVGKRSSRNAGSSAGCRASGRHGGEKVGSVSQVQIADIPGAIAKPSIDRPYRDIVADARIHCQAWCYLELILYVAAVYPAVVL